MDVYIGVSTISACNQLICQSVHIILQIRPYTLQFQCSLTLRIFVYNWLNNGVVFRLPYDNLCVCVQGSHTVADEIKVGMQTTVAM
jgi:hypothetical protein